MQGADRNWFGADEMRFAIPQLISCTKGRGLRELNDVRNNQPPRVLPP